VTRIKSGLNAARKTNCPGLNSSVANGLHTML
jgi:hypothetical protein